jgi:hypothetical protein
VATTLDLYSQTGHDSEHRGGAAMREDEYTEFKKTTGELNEAMVSISSILNKHRQKMSGLTLYTYDRKNWDAIVEKIQLKNIKVWDTGTGVASL